MFRFGKLSYDLKSSLPSYTFCKILNEKYPYYFISTNNYLLNGYHMKRNNYNLFLYNKDNYIISSYLEDLSYNTPYYKIQLEFLYNNQKLIENVKIDGDINIYNYNVKLIDKNTSTSYSYSYSNNIYEKYNVDNVPIYIRVLHENIINTINIL